jgi:hypothetical protein
MHLPGSPDRSTGAGDRRHDRFRLRRRLGPEDGPAYAAARLAALEEAARRRAASPGAGADPDGAGAAAEPVWRPLGPFAIPHGRTAGSGPGSRPRVAGRVAAVAVDPGDPEHLLAGGGGVWESRDRGRTWRPRADDQPSAAIGAVAFAPGDPSVAYAGTGQGEPLAPLGVGLLRSEDGGRGWRLLAAPELLGAGFHDLLVDPGDADRLLAATTAGLWASADGGRSWERWLAGRCWAISAGAGGELLAGGEHGLHRSEDGGAGWRRVDLPSAPGAFDRVAVARGAGQVTWVFAAGDGVGHLWRRERPGGPFEPVKPPADLQSQQAWRSWACAADPADPEVIWLGALGLHRGTRGPGGRWTWVDLTTRPAGDSLPPAQQAIVFDPRDPRVLYVANDGGLFRSPDGGRSWQPRNTGLAVAEVDHLSGHPDHPDWLLADAGDLGTLRYEGTEVWFRVDTPAAGLGREGGARGGTGAEVEAPEQPPIGLAEPTSAGGQPADSGLEDGLPAVPVQATVADPDRPGTVFAATDAGVWRSDDGGAGWRPAGRGLPNAPALALDLHRRARLLRVGLLGRGVWELPLDPDPAPAAVPVLRAARPDPDRPRAGGWWWEGPDIKVEAPPAPRDRPLQPVEFEDDRGPEATGLPDSGGRVQPGRPARLHVQVHQRGTGPCRNVRVGVLVAPACLSPPDLPAGPWLLDRDPPPGSPWRAAGPPVTVGDLDPGRSAVASVDWEVPGDLPRDLCLLAVATADGSTGGVWTTDPPLASRGLPPRFGGPDTGGRGSDVAGRRWGLKSLTVLGPGRGQVVRLELWRPAGRGPWVLAAEPWVAGVAAGVVVSRRLGGLARDAGLVPGRVGEAWRPELVTLVQEDPGLAERLDLGAVFPAPGGADAGREPPGPGGDGMVVWLRGIDLEPDRPEPLLVLLHEPPPSGRGSLLLLNAEGEVLGGHGFRAPG